jgi:hypothetical protein
MAFRSALRNLRQAQRDAYTLPPNEPHAVRERVYAARYARGAPWGPVRDDGGAALAADAVHLPLRQGQPPTDHYAELGGAPRRCRDAQPFAGGVAADA